MILVFSFSKTFASDSLFEDLLNLDDWVYIYELSLSKVDNYSFSDDSLRNIYETYKYYDSITKEEIIRAYENWDYDEYKMNGIVRNYNTFVYNTNKFFYFLSTVDWNNSLKNDKNIQKAILKNYKAVKSSYSKVKNLLKVEE
jgi:hypothetical protein